MDDAHELPPDPAAAVVETVHESARPPLLTQASRSAMQRLLAVGVVLKRQHAEDYQSLVVHEQAIGAVLAEMGLKMTVRREYHMVALMRVGDVDVLEEPEELADDADDGEGEHRALLRVTRMKRPHTLILMLLRAHFRERERAHDDRILIDLDTLKDRLKPLLPLLNSESRADKKISAAITLLEKHSILLPVAGNRTAREISPVITLALSSDKLQVLVDECQRQLEQISGAAS